MDPAQDPRVVFRRRPDDALRVIRATDFPLVAVDVHRLAADEAAPTSPWFCLRELRGTSAAHVTQHCCASVVVQRQAPCVDVVEQFAWGAAPPPLQLCAGYPCVRAPFCRLEACSGLSQNGQKAPCSPENVPLERSHRPVHRPPSDPLKQKY